VRRLALALLLAIPVAAFASGEALQRAFVEGMQQLEAGDAAAAERTFRGMLEATDSARVRLELARALYAQGKYEEAKALFREVSYHPDTPWRVRDNIAHFVQDIERRTGYLKLGVTLIADSNPGSIAEQKEFAIGGLRVTPAEAPEKVYGLRYSARGWLPFERLGAAGYLSASYNDYPGHDLDRLTLDVGGVKDLTESGRLRLKPGIELGSLAGARLYRFPYVAADAVLAESERMRLTGEVKLGKATFRDFSYLDARQAIAGFSVRRLWSPGAVLSAAASVERSQARERPYSYYGWELGPGIDTFWPRWLLMVGARASVGERIYAEADPLFGDKRSDEKKRLEVAIGNKRWRWRDSYVSLVASLERNRSTLGFYSYRKANVSLVIE
jgi:hypothetical protein